MKRYDDYQTSGLDWMGDIPAHWQVAPVYARYEVQLGKKLNKRHVDVNDTLPYLRNVDVQWGEVNVNELPGMTFSEYEQDLYRLRVGDLLVCEGGEVGRSAVWRDQSSECYYQMALHRLRPRSERDLADYLFYVMRLAAQLGVFEVAGNPNTITHLTAKKLSVQRFPFPPLDEQRQLAGYLDRKTAEIDALIQKKRALIDLLREQRVSVIDRAVTKGVNRDAAMKESGVQWLGDVPAHWTIPQLKYTTQFVNGAAFKPADWADDGVPIIRISNLNNDPAFNHSTAEVSERYHVHKGDLLFAWSGNRGTSFGPFLWHRDGLHYLNQHIFRLEQYDYDTRFFYWMLKAVTKHVEEQAHGIIGMVHITKSDLGAIRVPAMPVTEQRAIAAYINRVTGQIDATVQREEDLIDKLQELRVSLISEVVTGKRDVRAAAPADGVA